MINYNEIVRISRNMGRLFQQYGVIRFRGVQDGTKVTETVTNPDGSHTTRRMVVRGTFCVPDPEFLPNEEK